MLINIDFYLPNVKVQKNYPKSETHKQCIEWELNITKFTEKAENTATNVMKNVITKFQSNPLTQFQDTSAQNFNQNL